MPCLMLVKLFLPTFFRLAEGFRIRYVKSFLPLSADFFPPSQMPSDRLQQALSSLFCRLFSDSDKRIQQALSSLFFRLSELFSALLNRLFPPSDRLPQVDPIRYVKSFLPPFCRLFSAFPTRLSALLNRLPQALLIRLVKSFLPPFSAFRKPC